MTYICSTNRHSTPSIHARKYTTYQITISHQNIILRQLNMSVQDNSHLFNGVELEKFQTLAQYSKCSLICVINSHITHIKCSNELKRSLMQSKFPLISARKYDASILSLRVIDNWYMGF